MSYITRFSQNVIADATNSSDSNIASTAYFIGAAYTTLGVAGIQVSLRTDQNCMVWIDQAPTNALVDCPTGTTAATNDSTTITGTGTYFTKNFSIGDTIVFDPTGTNQTKTIASIVSDTVMTATEAFTGGSLSGKSFKLYPWDLRDSFAYTANGNFGTTVKATSSYYRVRVYNAGTATTKYLRLQTALCPIVESLPRTLDRNGNLKISTPTDMLGFIQDNTPNNESLVTNKIRLVGTIFSGSVLDSRFWTNAVSTGTVAQTNSEVILTSGTASPHYAQLYTSRRAKWTSGTSNKYRAQLRFGDSGTANVNRRWGIGWGATMPTVTDGAYFKLYGTTFTIATLRNTSEAEIAQGSFNGDYGPYYNPTLTVNATYEILYTLGNVYFYVNGTLLHKASFSTTHWTANTITFHAFADVNNTGASSAVTMTFRMMNISRLGLAQSQPTSYYHANGTTAAGGVNLKIGAGSIRCITIQALNNAVVTLADSTSALTPILWATTGVAAITQPLTITLHDIPFYNGLQLGVISANAQVTVVYE